MKSRIPFSGKGAKNTAKTRPLSPLRDRKKNKNFLTLLERKVQRHSTPSNYSSFYGKVDRTSMRPRRADRMPRQIDKLIQMWVQGFNLDTRSGKKLWNNCLRSTSQIHPCLFRLMGSNTCTYTCRERSNAAGTCMVGLKNVMPYIIRIRCNLSQTQNF